MSDQFEEFRFQDTYTGQCYDNNFFFPGRTQSDSPDFNSSPLALDSPGPFRVPKRRGRPVANNAARERSRVKTLRSAFLELQRTLPAVPPDTKLSKLDVLVLATTYIAHLMSALQDDGDVSQIFAANGCMHPVKILGNSLFDNNEQLADILHHTRKSISYRQPQWTVEVSRGGANLEQVVGHMMWTDLEVDDNGRVSVNEFGRCLRQQDCDVSNFTVLRIVSDGQTPQTRMDHETFVNAKEKLILELQNQPPLPPDDKMRKYKANYLDLWREHSRSRNETGEVPVSRLPHIVFSECNPTKELLDALISVKQDGSESINFMEFCEMLENLPQSGMIDENALLKAFQTEDMDGSGYISRTQLYSLLIENGDDPLKKEEVDEMMEDCGSGDRFKYTDWIQRVITIKSLSEK